MWKYDDLCFLLVMVREIILWDPRAPAESKGNLGDVEIVTEGRHQSLHLGILRISLGSRTGNMSN